MGIYRLYTGDDMKSHIEEQTLATHPVLAEPQAASRIVFGEIPVGTFKDWHPPPCRQYIVILSGQLEIGLGDGTLRRFDPGDARLVEDLTGQGHTTRVIGNEPVRTAAIPLADQGLTWSKLS